MFRRGLTAAVLLALLAGCAGGGAPGRAAVAVPAPAQAGVAYARTSSSQVLDLWLPAGDRRPAPLVIFVHGGGFVGGDKRAVSSKLPALLAAGYAVASVNYRLSSEARFPAAARDVKAAVRYLRASASARGLDPARFAVWGESAGANLAVLVGTTGDRPDLFDDPSLGNAGTSDAVAAVVDWYGPIDYARRERQLRAGGADCRSPQLALADRYTTAYLGDDVEKIPRRAAQANPVTYVRRSSPLPAFSIAHGTADCLVPPAQSTLLADALRGAGNRPDVHVLDGVTHGDPRFDRELLAPTIDWLDTVLSP